MKNSEDYGISFRRIIVFAVIACALILLLVCRLVFLQIFKGDEFLEQSNNRILNSTSVEAPRGEILDRMGRPLVTNRQGYSVFVEPDLIDKEEINNVAQRLWEVISAAGENFSDEFPITNAAPFEYVGNISENKNFSQYLKSKKINSELSAPEVIKELCDYYKVDANSANARVIVGMRYKMELSGSVGKFELVSDINATTVTMLREQYKNFSGVSVGTTTLREYVEPGLAGHILGRVGNIYAEQYEELKKQGYAMNDKIGRDGIESTMNQYLKGTAGVRRIVKNKYGQVVEDYFSQAMVPGNNVTLTIDKDLQRVAENSLNVRIQQLANYAMATGGVGADAKTGSVVAVEVKTGGILALANCPTIDLSQFNSKYQEYVNDPQKPLINRAISAAHPPGSSFKMVTGIAGLMSGAVNLSYTYSCSGVYRYFSGYQPTCWRGRAHGTNDIEGALRYSCNGFFFDVGRLTGIDKIVEYMKYFGLGELTGVELPGEVKGIRAGPEALGSGETWTSGMTIQASIGQSLNAFTTIQLAGYTQALANDGQRLKLHIVDSVQDYQGTNKILKNEPTLVETVPMSPEVMTAIRNGMKRVATEASISYALKSCVVSVAGKTGTAEVPGGSANAIFVCYAPADDPQIALAIVVEHGGEGSSLGALAADIINQYFAQKPTGDNIKPSNVLM